MLRIFYTIAFIGFINAIDVDIYVNTTTLHTVSEQFLGVTLDSSVRYYHSNWLGLNFTYITPLAAALGPLYWRYGGSVADILIFEVQGVEEYKTFTGYDLDLLCNFAKSTGWHLVFDLNQMLRTANNENWNSSNAKVLLDYASSHNCYMDFELGNEPDLYFREFQFNVTGKQLADGYIQLRNLLNTYDLYKNSTIVGPSPSGPIYQGQIDLINDFLNNGGGSAINVLTFHHYYFNGSNATVETYTSPDFLDTVLPTLQRMSNLTYRPIWLGETGIDWCYCAANLSDAYVAGFPWLDKLGLSALYGISDVIRQDIFGQYYGLLDNQMNTAPDYWLSFLHKKLIGSKVFEVNSNPQDRNLRIYARSNKNTDGFIVYGINVANYSFNTGCVGKFWHSQNINLPQVNGNQARSYVITTGIDGNLHAKTNKLNGVLMQWIPHQPTVDMNGNLTNLPITIPPTCQFFIAAGQSLTQTCPQGWHLETTQKTKCIKLVEDYTPPMFGANFDCTTYATNSSLLSIESAFENSEISGLTTATNCNQYFIGLYNDGKSWLWSNGETNTYKNWKNGYPTADTTKLCSTFDAKSGLWTNQDCDSLQCYICQLWI